MSDPTPRTATNTSWAASASTALAVRLVLFAAPVVFGWLVILVAGQWFVSVDGSFRVPVWFIQASLVGGVVATMVDLQTRRFLPLATLFGLSLTFPGPAPSRLSVALEASKIRNREQFISHRMERGLSDEPNKAATEAITLVTVLGTHHRLRSGAAERTTGHADSIAAELGVDDNDREKLTWSVLLHDIGMLTLPASILDKSGTLTDDEQQVFQTHTAEGESFLAPLADWLGSWRFATSQHHERWDGAGFPKGIGGERITLSARIVSVVDAYEAALSKGTAAATSEKAVAEILAASGTSFDPAVVQALRTVAPTMAAATGGLRPGVTISAAQGAAVLIAAAAMATVSTSIPATLALGSEAAAGVSISDTSSPLLPETAARAANNQSTTTTRSGDDASLAAGTGAKLTITTTVPETSTTEEPTSTTAPSTTTSSTTAPSTTAAPTTTVVPSDTATPTTAVDRITTTSTTTAPTTTAPAGPTAIDDAVNARQDRTKRINVLANDTPGANGSPIDPATLTIVNGPDHGTAEIKNGQVRYRSNTEHLGEDTLTYMICNDLGACSNAKVTITVG